MPESEMEQWCEIDGHEWVTTYFSYGLVLGPQAIDISRRCTKCQEAHFQVFVPKDEPKYRMPIIGPIIGW